MSRAILVGGTLLLGLVLTACDPDIDTDPTREQLMTQAAEEAEAPATVTETVTVEPEPEPVDEPIAIDDEAMYDAVTEAVENDYDDAELGKLALDLTWDSMSSSDRNEICETWSLDVRELEDLLLDYFFEAQPDPIVTREYARSFFDGKCG